jgi:SOS response regulatory protein OraA/RecX
MDIRLKEAVVFALKQLGRQDRTESELRASLAARYDLELTDAAMIFLHQYRLLDDAKIAENARERNIGRRAVGDALLREKLLLRGVSEDLVEQVIHSNEAEEEYRGREVYQLKFPKGATRAKVARYLWSRGFSENVIESILSDLPEESLPDE